MTIFLSFVIDYMNRSLLSTLMRENVGRIKQVKYERGERGGKIGKEAVWRKRRGEL